MKKIIVIVFLCFVFQGFSNFSLLNDKNVETDSSDLDNKINHSIGFELGGTFVLYSLFYDITFNLKNDNFVGIGLVTPIYVLRNDGWGYGFKFFYGFGKSKSNNSFSQEWNNLVPNYSFESVTNDWPIDTACSQGDNVPNCYSIGNRYDFIIEYWGAVDEWTHPLRNHVFCWNMPVPTADLREFGLHPSNTMGRSGIRYGYVKGDEIGEYLVVPIEGCFPDVGNCLSSNKTYYIEFFYRGSDSPSVWLTNNQPKGCNSKIDFEEEQLIFFHENANAPQWTRFRGYFKPNDNNKKWLTLGTKGEFDDIKIIEVDDDICRNVWYFDNTVFNYPMEIFQAGDSIVAGYGVDPESSHIAGNVSVLKTSHTIFRAGGSINLYPGFEVDSLNGAVFEAIIEPCKDLCPPINIPNKELFCISESQNIGFPEYEGTFAQILWYPDTYLDDENSPNPIFTPPSGVNGSIDYTVALYKNCGGMLIPSFTNVTVNYSDGLYPPEQVHIKISKKIL